MLAQPFMPQVISWRTPSNSARSPHEALAFYQNSLRLLNEKLMGLERRARDPERRLTKEESHQVLKIVSAARWVCEVVVDFRGFFDDRREFVHPSDPTLTVSAYSETVIFEPETPMSMSDRYEFYGEFFNNLSVLLSPTDNAEENVRNVEQFSKTAKAMSERMTPSFCQRFSGAMATLLFALGAGCGIVLACIYPCTVSGYALTGATLACSAALMALGGLFTAVSVTFGVKFAKRSCNFFADKVTQISKEIAEDDNQSVLRSAGRSNFL